MLPCPVPRSFAIPSPRRACRNRSPPCRPPARPRLRSKETWWPMRPTRRGSMPRRPNRAWPPSPRRRRRTELCQPLSTPGAIRLLRLPKRPTGCHRRRNQRLRKSPLSGWPRNQSPHPPATPLPKPPLPKPPLSMPPLSMPPLSMPPLSMPPLSMLPLSMLPLPARQPRPKPPPPRPWPRPRPQPSAQPFKCSRTDRSIPSVPGR